VSKFDLNEIDKAEEEAQGDVKEAQDKYVEVLSAAAYLEKAKGVRREAKERLTERIAEAQSCLTENIKHEIPAVRRAVWKAILNFELTRPLESPEEIETLIAQLTQRGLFVPDGNGCLDVYGKKFNVSPDSLFEEPEVAEIRQSLANMFKNVHAAIQSNAQLTPKELVARKTGGCSMFVPPEPVEKAGKTIFWRGGGSITVKNTRGIVEPVLGTGRIAAPVMECTRSKITLPIQSLQQSHPPDLTDNEDRIKKIHLLWYLVKRGIAFANWIDRAKEMGKVSEEKFFSEKALGSCFVDLGEAWHGMDGGEERWISRPVFVVNRTEETGQTYIQLVNVPLHLKEFFGKCLEKYPEADKFSGCPQPLMAVLQARFGAISQIVRRTTNKKAVLVTT